MPTLRKSTKASAFNHSYSLVPGPTSNKALIAVMNRDAKNKLARIARVPKSNFDIKKGFSMRGQRYAIIVVKGRKLSGKQIENRNNANYEKLRNRIVKAIFNGNARNRSNALGLATMFKRGVRTGRTATTNVLSNNALRNRIFGMAYPTAGHKGNFRKTVENLKRKSAAHRTAVDRVRYWNP